MRFPTRPSHSNPSWLRSCRAVLAAGALTWTSAVHAQVDPLWEASPYFRFNLESATVTTVDSVRSVTVIFSLTNPMDGDRPWVLRADATHPSPDAPFAAGTGARLAVILGWNTKDYANTGSPNEALSPVAFGAGTPAAPPISINALTSAAPLGDGRYRVTKALPKQAFGSGTAGLEGHPVWPNASGVVAPVPVKSAVLGFAISDPVPAARRQIVDFAKCQVCHNGQWNSEIEAVIPRLTLHGANRTEEPALCVICHNPNQTDIAYRSSGAEVPIDFKTMVHAIHGNKRRQTPLSVVGRGGALVDFSGVEFPANPRDCFRCHIDQGGKGTYELPLASGVLGTTINTRSVPGSLIDVDPANNLRITPTAAVCSSCHDSAKAREHMTSSKSGGAFGVLQSQIDSMAVKEKCASCHGPGKEKSVRVVHR